MRIWIYDVRRAKRLTQADVANACGISKAALSNIESGKRRPSVPLAKKLAAVLGVDWPRFYETEDQPFPTDDAASRVEDGIRRMVV